MVLEDDSEDDSVVDSDDDSDVVLGVPLVSATVALAVIVADALVSTTVGSTVVADDSAVVVVPSDDESSLPPSPTSKSLRPQATPSTASTNARWPRAPTSRPDPDIGAVASAALDPVSGDSTGAVWGGGDETVKPNGTAAAPPPGPIAARAGGGGFRISYLPGTTAPAAMEFAFRSKLPEPRQRFLAQVVEHGLATGLRTPAEFLRHFSPVTIMHALAQEPARRARILEATVGTRPRIALKKSPESSGEDLVIALEEGETDAATVVATFEPDDRVRFLDPQYLWAFVVEPRFWLHTATSTERVLNIRAHTSYIVECAMEESLVNHRDVVRALSVPTLVEFLPRDELANILERALLDGRDRTPFSERTMLDVVGLRALFDHIPLATVWEWVIGAKIAAPLGLLPDTEPLFDEREAHPDAPNDETVIVGGAPEPAPPLMAAKRA